MTPRGVGVYARELATHIYGKPDELAAKLKANGISWIAFMGAWFDPVAKPISLSFTASYVTACHAAGIECWLWGYPWAGNEAAYVESMRAATKVCGNAIAGWLHDPEISYTHGTHDDGARLLVELEAKARADLGVAGYGFTSYPIAQNFPRYPWDVFGKAGGFGSPQCYTIPAASIPKALESWRKHGFESLIVSMPGYGVNSGEHLDAYIAALVAAGATGAACWSFPQLDDREWATLSKWSDQLSKNACDAAAKSVY